MIIEIRPGIIKFLLFNSGLNQTLGRRSIEEGVLIGGFGSGVLELIIDKIKKDTIIKNIALPDKFIEHGDRQALLDKYGLSSKKIAEAIKKEWQK